MEILETGRGGPMFRWLGEPLAIDLANTVLVVRPGDTRDLLSTREQLALWLDHERERLGECGFALAHLAELRDLRDVVRRLLTAASGGLSLPTEDADRLNALSAAAPSYPRLELARGGRAERVEESAGDGPLAELLTRISRSAIDLVAGADRDRLRICAAPNCGMLFLANPAKPGQRWCCAACGNRARVATHYRRRRGPRQAA